MNKKLIIFLSFLFSLVILLTLTFYFFPRNNNKDNNNSQEALIQEEEKEEEKENEELNNKEEKKEENLNNSQENKEEISMSLKYQIISLGLSCLSFSIFIILSSTYFKFLRVFATNLKKIFMKKDFFYIFNICNFLKDKDEFCLFYFMLAIFYNFYDLLIFSPIYCGIHSGFGNYSKLTNGKFYLNQGWKIIFLFPPLFFIFLPWINYLIIRIILFYL